MIETSGAGFKPVPVVQKPISSLLEKIRQRKLEVSKKMSLLNNSGYSTENDDSLIEPMTGTDSRKVSTRGGGEDNLSDKVEVDTKIDASLEDIKSSLDASITDGVKGLRTHSSPESEKSPMAVSEEPTPTFRAPVDDTRDLFGNSETIDDKDDKLDNQHSSPMEEVLAPSLLTMNLKIDSVPLDDISSDEDDNDKENLKPITFKPSDPCPSPKGDPVKAFVDDEAEEEDDSDHDIRFNENDEDDGNEDSDELNDLIVTGYEEKSIDNERRNELHQKWLEQQDAAGTDNLMQRLGCGPKVKENTLFDVEIESDEDDEGSSDDEEDVGPAKAARINARKAKQMIPQMFADKEDPFVSSDDEETEKMLVKQRLLEKVGDKATLIPPAEDENSREIFGLIKKLNNAPIAKKKQKVPSFFETLITGGSSSSSSSKSSFLGRKILRMRAVAKEIRPTQKATAKFTSSQAKSFTQSSQIVAETTPGTSLIEILKRSSMQSTTCNQDNMVGMTQTIISAFKIPKKPFAKVKNMWCVFGRDSELHVKFDITLNQPNGSTVTSIVRSAATNEVTARHLIVLVKEFAKCQDINNASSGTLSSIAYCFLCIYFLIKCKILPPVPSGNEIRDLSSENIANLLEEFQTSTLNFEATPDPLLSDLLYSFFRFYTQDFDFKVHAISLSHAGFVKKADLGWPHTDLEGKVILRNQVVILNPYGSENMSQSVNKNGMKRIEAAFKAACKILLDGRAKALFHIPPKPEQ
ncbi:transcriptional regulator ATRX [Heracleum sosnowskyi]|uniref:Transcriptional regulator ATRX n=1 Tax=Heracleum sosnowskyi TaxID=360622 RepID=A0AAD8GMJ8_9APIA|nr:transcriptional regulator ATRX [Heracleum sosnowskyi]